MTEIEVIIRELRQAVADNASDKRDQLHAKLLAAAIAQPEVFVRTIADIVPVWTSDLFEIYWALAPEAARWRTFFISELDRLLAFADTVNRSERDHIRYELMGMTNAVEKDAVLWEGIRERLWHDVTSDRPQARRYALILLDDLSPNLGDAVLMPRLDSLRFDPDWRIRYLARYYANNDRRRPLTEGIPFIDKLRAVFSDPKRP